MKNNKIILGVTGGIAAYKSADLCSKLTAAGYDVHVIMTASAQQLITQRCFQTLSRNPVICSLWDVPEWKPEHIELSEAADLMVVAPCTANFLQHFQKAVCLSALGVVCFFMRNCSPYCVIFLKRKSIRNWTSYITSIERMWKIGKKKYKQFFPG